MNALWGRFDQTLANINTLYMLISSREHQPLDVYLVSEDSIIFCLQPVSIISEGTLNYTCTFIFLTDAMT